MNKYSETTMKTATNLLTLQLGALQEIAKCEVSQNGAIAMKHIAESALVKGQKILMGESLEGGRSADTHRPHGREASELVSGER